LRGYEGIATKSYYIGLATRIKKDGFKFSGRSKRPPKDPVNSLLSFAYSLIFGEMQIALLSHGLDNLLRQQHYACFMLFWAKHIIWSYRYAQNAIKFVKMNHEYKLAL
jgi:hypothetical protein